MAEARDFNCPNCGSPLMTDGTQNEIKCAYCGSAVIVPHELRIKSTPPVAPQVQSLSTFDQNFNYNYSDQVSKQVGEVGKVVAGVTLSAVLAPIIITGIVLLFVGVILVVVFMNVNKSISTAMGVLPTVSHSFPTLAVPQAKHAPLSSPTPAFTPTPTITPTPIPMATPFAKVLLQDKFTNSASGWDKVNETDYTVEYVNGGGYRIFVNASDGGEATWLSKNYKDVNIMVDAKYVAGPSDGLMGILCRVRDKVGFYSFFFSTDGYYAIDKYVYTADGSKPDTLAEGTLDPNTLQAEDSNQLRADCVGKTLTLYLNNQPLLQVTDSSYTSGGVGLIAQTGASGEAGVDTLFNNFVVKGR